VPTELEQLVGPVLHQTLLGQERQEQQILPLSFQTTSSLMESGGSMTTVAVHKVLQEWTGLMELTDSTVGLEMLVLKDQQA
jgi:hypothetical protein